MPYCEWEQDDFDDVEFVRLPSGVLVHVIHGDPSHTTEGWPATVAETSDDEPWTAKDVRVTPPSLKAPDAEIVDVAFS